MSNPDDAPSGALVRNGNLADWPDGVEFRPRTRRSRLARDWYLITQVENAGITARRSETSVDDQPDKLLPVLEVSGPNSGWTRVEIAIDPQQLLQAQPNILGFVAAARWKSEGASGGIKGLLRNLMLIRRGNNGIETLTTFGSDIVLDTKAKRHRIPINKERRDVLRVAASSVANDPGSALFIAFYFGAGNTPYLLTDVGFENSEIPQNSDRPASMADPARALLTRVLADRLVTRLTAARLARGTLKAERFDSFDSITQSKAKLIEADLVRGGIERVTFHHMDRDEEDLDFIVDGYQKDWNTFASKNPNPDAIFEAVLETVANTIALREVIYRDFAGLANAGPHWRPTVLAGIAKITPQIKDVLNQISSGQLQDLGSYRDACGGRSDFYVDVLRRFSVSSKKPGKVAKAEKAEKKVDSPPKVETGKAKIPGARAPTSVRKSRFKGALQTDACFNDYLPQFRGQVNALERQALRERSWRIRELLALTASDGALDFEGLLAVCRRLRQMKAGPAISAAAGMVDPNQRALVALARVVANQELTEQDCKDAIDIYEAVRGANAATALREIDWIQLFLLFVRTNDVAAAQQALEDSGLQASRPVEFALLASNLLRASSGPVPPREHLFPLNLLYRKTGLEEIRVAEAATPFAGLGTGSLDRIVTDGPLVSVLMTTFNSTQDIGVAIRATLNQTWRNLELIIIDDCSSEDNFAAVKAWETYDPRIKVLRNDSNLGTYASKNRGLAIATGEFVTCHDSDDWSHPRKIELQVEALAPDSIASFSLWVRSSPFLEFQLFSAAGYLNYENPSSLLYRRSPVQERMGFYDSVRTGADSEFKQRMELVFGTPGIQALDLPLAFGLMHEQALTANSLGRGWFSHDRKIYRSAWRAWHDQISAGMAAPYVPLEPASRKFAVPQSLSPNKPAVPASIEPSPRRHYDVVMISDFRMSGGNTVSAIEEVKCQLGNNIRTAICQVGAFRKGFMHKEFIDPKVQELVSGGLVDWIDLNDPVDADILTIRYPGVFQFADRLHTGIKPKVIRIILNQPPAEKDSRDRRYDVDTVAANVQRIFGAPQRWAPIGPSVRESVLPFVRPEQLTERDWFNIIDINEWSGPRTNYVSTQPVIGRHSRDDYSKWPDRLEDLLGAYPDIGKIDVRILGGIDSILPMLGGRAPSRWTVYNFNALTPRDFLGTIDFFVYFHHPLRVEAFGRTIIEAMASGCVVVLPDSFEPLFGDSVTYCKPREVPDVIQAIYADPARYQALSLKGFEYVRRNFSYDAHLSRLESLVSGARQEEVVYGQGA